MFIFCCFLQPGSDTCIHHPCLKEMMRFDIRESFVRQRHSIWQLGGWWIQPYSMQYKYKGCPQIRVYLTCYLSSMIGKSILFYIPPQNDDPPDIKSEFSYCMCIIWLIYEDVLGFYMCLSSMSYEHWWLWTCSIWNMLSVRKLRHK